MVLRYCPGSTVPRCPPVATVCQNCVVAPLSIVSILFHGIVLVINVQVLVLSDSIYWYLLYGI